MQNVLLKHGKELPGPDRMYLNADSIIFVEPVSTDPKVAQLIRSESAEVASTTTRARPGMRRRVGSSSPLAELLCPATTGMTFHVVH